MYTDLKHYPFSFSQLTACFCVFFFPLALGASSGFSAVAMPQLKQNKDFIMTEGQLSWFGKRMNNKTRPTPSYRRS
jgi:hypothetical protein